MSSTREKKTTVVAAPFEYTGKTSSPKDGFVGDYGKSAVHTVEAPARGGEG